MYHFKKLTSVFIIMILQLTRAEIQCSTDDNEDDSCFEQTTQQMKEMTFSVPDEKWQASALKDIAYYLRNHKFNEWDRRYFIEKPNNMSVGYYKSFPTPSLRTIHWKVYENCYSDFYKCIIYLHSIIENAPLTRADDIVTVINEKQSLLNETMVQNLDLECKKVLTDSEASGLPFDSPTEKFQWRTSASYYMCWYTMLETPALSMLGETCDNFASCLDKQFGYQNHDPRSDDRMSFFCALYSFCPDICCPVKHLKSMDQCFETKSNPCFLDNYNLSPLDRVCELNRKENRNLKDIVANKWNVSCHCEDKGFIWKSEFGMCVDINECVTGEHNCGADNCLNLPGTFECICQWGHIFSEVQGKCIKQNLLIESVQNSDACVSWIEKLMKYIGLIT